MNGNEIKEATFEDALYCAKALVGVERCEECRFYTLGDLWCDDTYRIMHEALEEVKAYRAIGTVEEFKALKEKNVAKKPIEREMPYSEEVGFNSEWYCPTCGGYVGYCTEGMSEPEQMEYCNVCGQHIARDWSE